MFFSPISERSLKVRLLYMAFYIVLCFGGITVVLPLVIMLAGSVEPSTVHKGIRFFPSYLTNDDELWRTYVASKYNQSIDILRTAWGQPDLEWESIERPQGGAEHSLTAWREFLDSAALRDDWQTCGFLGTSRMPQKNRREFARWMLERFKDNLSELNTAMRTQFPTINSISPPSLTMYGSQLERGPLVEAFMEFIRKKVPESERVPLNCAAFYRTSFLPRTVGATIADFNQKYGTNYSSYAEVPFTATAPEVAAETWFFFVSKILRPDFVRFTPQGEERFRQSKLTKAEFIRVKSRPQDLRVESLDTLYGQWADARELKARDIPQRELDYQDFLRERGYWKGQFLTQNFAVVFDEIFVNGRAVKNTVILVALSIAGTLFVNPMAAYALSRYRPRQSYQILLFCLVTIALPGEVTMIPIFLQLKELGLLNTFGALVIPGLANGFSIFLLKGFFDSLPRELYEAAEIDGASEVAMFWQITMGLSGPILAVLALNAFVHAYGVFMYALIICPDPKMWTIMVYLFQLMQTMETPVLYAALIIAAIPTTLVFVFCQNIILRGIAVPSEK